MKTLWIGFSGEQKDAVRNTLAAALVRELRTRGVNAQWVALRQPVWDCTSQLYQQNHREAEFAQSLQAIFGNDVFRDAALRRVADMQDCAMAIVPDVNDEADAEFIRAQHGLVWEVPSETRASTLKEASEALKPLLDKILTWLK